jgi:hypothetical protein
VPLDAAAIAGAASAADDVDDANFAAAAAAAVTVVKMTVSPNQTRCHDLLAPASADINAFPALFRRQFCLPLQPAARWKAKVGLWT